MIKDLLKLACGVIIGLTLAKGASAVSPDGSFVQTPGEATETNLFITFPPLGTTASAVIDASGGNYKAEIELAKPAAQTYLEKGTLTPQLSRAFELVREHNKKFCEGLVQANTKYLARQIVAQRFPKSKPATTESAPVTLGPPVPGDDRQSRTHE